MTIIKTSHNSPTSATVYKTMMSEPVYTRRGLPTIYHIGAIIWCAIRFYYFATTFILALLVIYSTKPSSHLANIYILAVAFGVYTFLYPAILTVSAKALYSPMFLYKEDKNLCRALSPLIFYVLYTPLVGMLVFQRFDSAHFVETIVCIFVMAGMIHPRSENVIAYCFVPFSERRFISASA